MMKLKKLLSVCCVVLCAACLCIAPVYADTDGTELQVAEKSALEIQLGSNWSGVEFQLKTDAGLYPNAIPVGEDGILRLEIGGSSTYTLSCLNSSVAIPENNGEVIDPEAPASEASDETAVPDTDPNQPDQAEQPAPSEDESLNELDTVDKDTLAGIPIKHIVLFGGGLVLAVGGLIAIRIVSKRRGEGHRDDYDEYDDDDE